MRLFRSSGNPIEQAHIDEFKDKLKESWTTLEGAFGKPTSANSSKYQAALEITHKDLAASYPIEGTVEFPDTPEAMDALCQVYGCIAFCREEIKDSEETELIAYIMDK